MEEVLDLSYDSIVRYFNTLRYYGYKNYEDVYKLIVLTSLQEVFETVPQFLTENDFKQITEAINCLSGTTCLIDFPSYSEGDTLFHKNKARRLRIVSQDNPVTVYQNFYYI